MDKSVCVCACAAVLFANTESSMTDQSCLVGVVCRLFVCWCCTLYNSTELDLQPSTTEMRHAGEETTRKTMNHRWHQLSQKQMRHSEKAPATTLHLQCRLDVQGAPFVTDAYT